QLEAQHVYEEADGRVVLAEHDGDEAEVHAARIRATSGSVVPKTVGPNCRQGDRCPVCRVTDRRGAARHAGGSGTFQLRETRESCTAARTASASSPATTTTR